MSTIITVHGTFAKMEVPPGDTATAAAGQQAWWRETSAFAEDMRAKLTGTDGAVTIERFDWTGDNSERGRREEARRLLARFRELEAKSEPYAAIGHSHGGSIIARALLLAASKRETLPNLQKWVTVGTPFIELRKERFLFLRLPLVFKALFVASFMLLLMFLVPLMFDLAAGRISFDNETRLWRTITGLALVAVPFIVYYTGAWLHDRNKLFHFRRSTRNRANAAFADRWVALTHEDDEAVQGLSKLASIKAAIFSADFAVPLVSLVSVFLLPLAYVWLLMSPAQMVAIADFLKTNVYELDRYDALENSFERDISGLRSVQRRIRQMRNDRAVDEGFDPNSQLSRQSRLQALRAERRALRRQLQAKYPEFQGISRALRFQRQFFERRGQPCADGQLCGKGRNIRLNSRLLFHLVTDEASSFVLNPEMRPSGQFGRIIGIAIPILLVPIIFGLVAIVLVYAIQWLARFASYGLSKLLDSVTWSEINRAALGNDTEAEVAVRAGPKPVWITQARPFLPDAIAQPVAARSNAAAHETIERLRAALSDLAFVDGAGDQNRSLLALLSWQELIHMVYFDVAELRALIAVALADSDGFRLRGEAGPDTVAALRAVQPAATAAPPTNLAA